MEFVRRSHLPDPDVLITGLGTAIHYAPKLVADTAWREHIDHQWNSRAIRRLLGEQENLVPQPLEDQSVFKLSYTVVDPQRGFDPEDVVRLLRQNDLSANVFLSFGRYLDVLPARASKGAALRYVADQWEIPLENVLAAGGSGADEDMMRGNTLGVVVANRHQEELSQLVDVDRIYFARQPHADGILEAFEHYDFFGSPPVATT
jgi:sucrose-phosphate synthase